MSNEQNADMLARINYILRSGVTAHAIAKATKYPDLIKNLQRDGYAMTTKTAERIDTVLRVIEQTLPSQHVPVQQENKQTIQTMLDNDAKSFAPMITSGSYDVSTEAVQCIYTRDGNLAFVQLSDGYLVAVISA